MLAVMLIAAIVINSVLRAAPDASLPKSSVFQFFACRDAQCIAATPLDDVGSLNLARCL